MYYSLKPVLCFVFIVINVEAASIKKVSVDLGKNVTIKCPLNNSRDVMWEREGKNQDPNLRMAVMENGSLFLQRADKSDSGIYVCIRENDVKDIKGEVNVTRQLEVYNLRPNTTYEFRIWATNQLGKSPVVDVFGTTNGQYSEIELARHLLKGADQFDTRWWAAAVGVVLGTLVLLGIGTCVLLYQECRMPPVDMEEEPEIIELVPNIILNPGFEGPSHLNDIMPDENSNNETPVRLNNNSVVHSQNL